MKITAIPQLYRNLRRWRQILTVLRRYGLADWMSQYRGLPFSRMVKDHRGTPLTEYTREQRVRMALTDLGPTFIKLGQILAARPDLVGPALSEELKRLRANVRPESIDKVRATLERELGPDYESHFRMIDPEPLATASIGQVHRAVLKDGHPVVLKVQRSGIENTVKQDVEILSGLAVMAERVDTLAAWNPKDVVRQLAPIITRELDFSRERQSLEHFVAWMQRRGANVVVPKPVIPLCTRRVLVMDELRGRSLASCLRAKSNAAAKNGAASSSNHAANGSSNGRPSEDANRQARESNASAAPYRLEEETRSRFSQTIAEIYMAMIFEEGLYHADPHTGNLFCLEDGRLGMLDFGMTGRIDDALRENIEDMLVAISAGDQNRLIRLIRRVGDAPPTLDESALAIDVSDFIATYGRQSMDNFDLTGALNALTEVLHKHSIKLPNQSALLLKMLISLEGTLSELGASFDSLNVIQSLAKKTMLRRLSPQRQIRRAQRIYQEAESFLESAPDELVSMMQMVRRGETRVTLEHQRLNPSINRLVLGVMASALFLGSSLMLAQQVPPMFRVSPWLLEMEPISLFGLLGVMFSMALMLWLLLAIGRSGHLTRNNDD
ncbi:MAG: AarF/UbiB family protein [Planctomycetota bacterium]